MPTSPTYQKWMEAQGIPIHRGYYIEDLRTVEVGPWSERECNGAFIEVAGLEGVSEVRVTEIPPGKTLPPLRSVAEEAVYVLDGVGQTSVWVGKEERRINFEWDKRSMFLIPPNVKHQFTNMQGNRPARLAHVNYLPVAMSVWPDPDFIFNNPYVNDMVQATEGEQFATAKAVDIPKDGFRNITVQWWGNFFPDLAAWDRLEAHTVRGSGGSVLDIRFPNSEMTGHMSVFPSGRYKKGHRHGPGVVIIIPAGDGYSIMWEEGREKLVVPWHEASLFVPPNRWFHQHFNVGGYPARYLALHTLPVFGRSEKLEDKKNDQIEYPDEDPFVREKFDEELAKRGEKSDMPEEAYKDYNFTWATAATASLVS